MAINGLRAVGRCRFSGFSLSRLQPDRGPTRRGCAGAPGGRFAVPMVVRMPYGGRGACPGAPLGKGARSLGATRRGLKRGGSFRPPPRTARAVLVSAIRAPDPVIFMKPKQVYRSDQGGGGRTRKEGDPCRSARGPAGVARGRGTAWGPWSAWGCHARHRDPGGGGDAGPRRDGVEGRNGSSTSPRWRRSTPTRRIAKSVRAHRPGWSPGARGRRKDLRGPPRGKIIGAQAGRRGGLPAPGGPGPAGRRLGHDGPLFRPEQNYIARRGADPDGAARVPVVLTAAPGSRRSEMAKEFRLAGPRRRHHEGRDPRDHRLRRRPGRGRATRSSSWRPTRRRSTCPRPMPAPSPRSTWRSTNLVEVGAL